VTGYYTLQPAREETISADDRSDAPGCKVNVCVCENISPGLHQGSASMDKMRFRND
jgi:hypothetical protein